MPDQTSNVPGGLSQLLKTAKPGRAEPTIGRDTTHGNVTSFSKDLDQAQQQQRANGEANRNGVVAIDTPKKLPVTATFSERGRGFQTSITEAMQLPQRQQSSASTPVVSNAAADMTAPTPKPIAEALNGTMVKVVTQDTLAGRSRQLAYGSEAGGLPQNSLTEEQAAADVAGRLAPTVVDVPVNARIISDAAADMTTPTPIAGAPNGTMGKVVTQDTLAGRSRQLANSSDEYGFPQNSLTEEQAAVDVAGRLAPTGVDVPANARLVSDAAADMTVPTPIAGALNGTIVAGRLAPTEVDVPVNAQLLSNAASDMTVPTPIAGVLSGTIVAGRLAPTEVDVPVNAQLLSDAAFDMKAPTPIAGALNGTMGKVVTQDTQTGRSGQLANGSYERGLSQDSLIKAQATAGVAGVLAPTAVDVPVNARFVSDAASGMTAPTPIAGALNGTMGKVVTQDTLAERSSQLANGLNKNTGMATAASLSSGNLRWPVEGVNAAMTAPETLPSDPAVKSIPAQVNTMGLTQVTSGDGIVTQATLAGRLRQSNNELMAKGAEVLPKPGDFGLLKTGTTPLNARGLESLPASGTPLLNDSQSGINSLMAFTDGIETVQQRIATTEAMLAQMAGETVHAVVKPPTADNMLLAMSGGTVAAPAVQHTDSVTGPIIQAPLNIPLTTANAETALAGNVKWMTNEGVKNAVMTVTPHGMGPISIKIGIDGNQMDVSIIASQHTTREALESMLPRLREQLAVQGHESVKVDVSDGKSEQSRSGSGQAFAESRNPTGATPQDNQSNSSKNGEKAENDSSEELEVVSESFMAEDLQRVAARVVGEVDGRPVFDAYV